MADKITEELDELHKQARSAKRLLEPEWLMCLAFFSGKQWMKWTDGGLQKPTLDAGRITVVENRVAGVVRTELAKMTKNRPVFVVTPNTGDEEDANASDLAERMMRYLWRHLKMHELSLKALEWSRVCAAGFLKCYWDSTIGESMEVLVGPDGNVLPDPQSGGPMRGDQMTAQMLSTQLQTRVQSKRIAQGDVRVEVRSPFQMFVDPICDSFPEAEWVIEESVKSLEYAKRRFGDKAGSLKADTAANPGLVEARTMGGAAAGGSYKGVKIREYWCKPSSKHPQGCRIVWSQGKVLLQDERPFDPMPYVMLTGVPVPGRLFGMGVVELLRGPQTELNKTLSQLAENRSRVGNPTIVGPKQAIQNPEQFEASLTIPGGVYYHDMSYGKDGVPFYLDPPALPDYVKEEPDRIAKSIEDISGQHEVTNANVPPGVTAASAITLLQEADDTRLGLGIQDYEEQLGRFGSKILTLVANFYSDARTIKIAGDEGDWEIFDFRGAMLRGNTHVEVQAGSAFPQSLAMKQAQIKDWMTFFMESGNPPKGRQLAQFLRDSGMGASDRLVQEYTDTETQVNRENAQLAQGRQLQINDYDDDQGHVDGHEAFERSTRFQALPPPVQQNHLAHTNLHRQRLDQQQQKQLEMQLQMQGQVPPNLSAAALQDQQQLSNLQGVQQMQGTQQGQLFDAEKHAQQQGYSQASQEQQQRHAQEAHEARLQQQAEQHQQRIQHAEEQHHARLAAAKRQPQGGGRDGRRNAA